MACEPDGPDGGRPHARARAGELRSRRLDRDVRAHAQLRGAVREDRALARARRRAVLSRVRAPALRVSVRGRRWLRLDGARVLHRRHHAERGSVLALRSRSRDRRRVAPRRHALRADVGGVVREPHARIAPSSSRCSAGARSSSAGACSSSRAPSCSAIATAASGSSRTTACSRASYTSDRSTNPGRCRRSLATRARSGRCVGRTSSCAGVPPSPVIDDRRHHTRARDLEMRRGDPEGRRPDRT